MISKHLKIKNQAGFSLMELLVTVSIIGVLATAGVPVYRRMVGKAKTSEAKVNLGTIANVESMFSGEYQTYSSNLNMMGFATDGAPAQSAYAIGFYDNACASIVIVPAANQDITDDSPNFFDPNYYKSAFGRAAGNLPVDITGLLTPAGVGGPKGGCDVTAPAPFVAGFPGVPAYLAGASGGIRAGVDPDAAATNDVWTIDQNRVLLHTIDGT